MLGDRGGKPEKFSQTNLDGMWFQQDWANVHHTVMVHRYLGEKGMVMDSIQGYDNRIRPWNLRLED